MEERIKKDSLHFAKAFILGRKLLCTILALLPFLYLLHIVSEYSVDVPYWDGWNLIPLIEKSYQGTLAFHDFYDFYGHSRIVFTKLILLGLVRLTGWNSDYQSLIKLLLGIGIFVILICQLRATEKIIKSGTIFWLIPVFSLIVFSMTQWNNWMCGWHIYIFLIVFLVVAGIVLLGSPIFRWRRFISAIVFGVIAVYIFSSGFVYLVVGLIIIFSSGWDKKNKWVCASLWMIISFIIVYSYLRDFPAEKCGPGPFELSTERLVFVLKYLGTPLLDVGFSYHLKCKLAFSFGLVGLIGFVVLPFILIRYCRIRFKVLVPWIALGMYSIGSALMTSIGRSHIDPNDHSMSSRYVTHSSLFWVSISLFLYLIIRFSHAVFTSRVKIWGMKSAGFILLSGIVVMVIFGSLGGAKIITIRSYDFRRARNALLLMRDVRRLKALGPLVTFQRARILKKYHLSVFRER